MEGKEVFSITEFARFSRTTRRTLLHYDEIGLLEPVSRGANNYRFYSGPQLGAINLIRTLQTAGMPLFEIVDYKKHRSPENAAALLDAHLDKIDEAMDELKRTRKLMAAINDIIKETRGVDESAVTITHMPERRIVMGIENDYSDGRNANDALLAFYKACQQRCPKMDLNYPAWGYFDEGRVKERNWRWPSRYYFFNPDGPDCRPEGHYAVGYTRGTYGEFGDVYTRVLDYVEANGWEACGPVYEEYPLNELSIGDPHNYLMRVLMRVRKA